MAIKLPTLPRGVALTDAKGLPTLQFQVWWQAVIRAVETQEAAQDQIIADLQAVQAEQAAQLALIEAAQAELEAQLLLIQAAQAAAEAADARALGVQEAASMTFGAIDPSFKTVFDDNAPPP